MKSNISYPGLAALAPLELRNERVNRYHGDDIAIPIGAFCESDQAVLRGLYLFLQPLFDALRGHDRKGLRSFQGFLDSQDLPAIFGAARRLGAESYRLNPTPSLAKTIHDVRGGGLASLLGSSTSGPWGAETRATPFIS